MKHSVKRIESDKAARFFMHKRMMILIRLFLSMPIFFLLGGFCHLTIVASDWGGFLGSLYFYEFFSGRTSHLSDWALGGSLTTYIMYATAMYSFKNVLLQEMIYVQQPISLPQI